LIAGWSSPVARQAHNLKVPGSNPGPATKQQPPASARKQRLLIDSQRSPEFLAPNYLQKIQQKALNFSMIISKSRRFTFVHIHKTGGTSMERALDPHLAWNDLILGSSVLGESVQTAYSHKFGLNKHSGVSDIEKVCGSSYVDNYYTFSLVRHPVARLCSMYNFVATVLTKWAAHHEIPVEKIEDHITPFAVKKKPALKWAASRVYLRTKSFSEFIRHEELRHEPGFRTQASMLVGHSDKIIKAQYFRIEDHDSWVAALGNRLGIELQIPHANQSESRLADEHTVSAEDRAYIATIFRDDYEALGYPG
jgi:hypothetical protein